MYFLDDWFRSKIDINNLLTSANVYEKKFLADGKFILVFKNSIPNDYLNKGGPLPYAFLISPNRNLVFGIGLPQEKDIFLSNGYNTKNKQNSLLESIFSTFKFIESEVDTSGWKIYKNEEYEFELKYPNDWVFVSKDNDRIVFYNQCGRGFPIIYDDFTAEYLEFLKSCGSFSVEIGRNLNSEKLSIKEWYDNFSKDADPYSVVSVAEEKVESVNSIKARLPFLGRESFLNYLSRGSDIFFLRYPTNYVYGQDIFPKILSSFKFIN